MTPVKWSDPVRDVFLDLAERDRNLIVDHLRYLAFFPHMYPVRTRGRFRRHRWFQAGNWLVYYRVADGVVYIRGIWPARIP
jgi:plasmid stabilization system protein ParE